MDSAFKAKSLVGSLREVKKTDMEPVKKWTEVVKGTGRWKKEVMTANQAVSPQNVNRFEGLSSACEGDEDDEKAPVSLSLEQQESRMKSDDQETPVSRRGRMMESRAQSCVPPDETAMSKLQRGFDAHEEDKIFDEGKYDEIGEDCECCLGAGALSESYVKGVTRRKRLQRWRPMNQQVPSMKVEIPSLEGGGLLDKLKKLNVLKAVSPEVLNTVDQAKGDWVCVKFAVDSGATDTVMNEDELECIQTQDGMAKKRGIEYEVANGIKIPNEGEKDFEGTSDEGVSRRVKAQVCAVTKSLMSVRRMVAAGHRVVFDETSFIEDTSSGERMYLDEEDGMYILKLWVKDEGF